MTMTAPPSSRPATRPSRSYAPLASGIAYTLAWLIGLTLASSSTQIHATGAQIVHAYTGHRGALTAQYLLTEGAAGLLLAAVIWPLAAAAPARRTGRLILSSGLAAATVSLAQAGLGAWLTLDLVPDHNSANAATVFRLLNQLDGAKMLLLAITATATAAAIARRQLSLPRWLGYTAAALATTITASGIGYLILDNTLAAAAWLSLPCLLVFITGTGIALTSTSPTTQSTGEGGLAD